MKNYIDDGSINHNKSHIIGIWNISELRHFLGDCALAFPFHVVDNFIPENAKQKKY